MANLEEPLGEDDEDNLEPLNPREDEDKNKTEFLNRIKSVKDEVKNKFQKVRKELDDKELKILKRIEEIEKEILESYEKVAITLKEIVQAKEKVIETFKSNVTSTLRKKNLEMYEKEVEEQIQNSKIDSIVELDWDTELLNLSRGISGVSINIKKPDHLPSQSLPKLKNPSKSPSQNNDPMMQRKFQSAQAQLNVHQEQILPHQRYPDEPPMPTLTPPQHIQPKSLPPEVNSLHQSIRNLREKNIKVYIHNIIPGELLHLAGQCVKLEAPIKFSHSIVCELIIASLSDKKKPSDVRDGLRNMAQFALCIFTNTFDPATHTNFKAGTDFFGFGPLLSGADQIFPFLGYDYDPINRNFLLNREKLAMPETNETIVFLVSDLLMAEQDLKTFDYIGELELIEFYQKYPDLSQIPESINQSQTYSGPHPPANQSQYSSTNTPLDTTPQMHQHSGSHSQIPQPSSHRTGFEGQYASGSTGSGQIHQQIKGFTTSWNVPTSGGSTHNMTGREWSCPHCTALNVFLTRICHVCDKTPDSKSGWSPGQNAPASKMCDHCRQMNKMQEVNCTYCGASFM